MLSEERTQQIEQAIAALGDQWTNRLVYEQVGGNYEALAQYLKQRRAQVHDEAAVAVAVLELPEPEPPPAPPPTLLHLARARRDQTARAEQALGVQEQTLKQQRQALGDAQQTLAIGTMGQRSDGADLARRQQVREVLTQVEEIEQARRAVHLKRREQGRVVEVRRRIIFGARDIITKVLGGQQINTAYVERDNLTSRQTNGRLVRKTLSHSKKSYFLRRHLELEDAVFNFVRPHQALRIAVSQPTPGRKWQQRSPAMAAGLTDHIWSLEELLSYRVPPPKD